MRLAESASRRLQFHKRSQLFIRVHNKPLSVAAVRVNNPDCPPLSRTSTRPGAGSARPPTLMML
ncbi:MAG: hypothetical protein DME71_10045 [Verrucomicrobia bacterium]|nr:MAG: hypothetical protein DME71_10045 [Verrucomicrobiota bacterium]